MTWGKGHDNTNKLAPAYPKSVEAASKVGREETLAAIREGLADVGADRTKPARRALNVLAKKYGIPMSEK